jgi:eukaryotic-like serine/threonine-protein kinase
MTGLTARVDTLEAQQAAAARAVALMVVAVGLAVWVVSCTTRTPEPAGGAAWTSPVDGMVQVYVPGGEFLMGSSDADAETRNDQKPQHTVYLDAFWIDRTEVTADQYAKCVAAGKCAEPGCAGAGKGDHPVVCVTWQDAADYCAWAGRRLPTEAEWEKAARGTDGRRYPWGNEPAAGNLLNFCDRNCSYNYKDQAVDDGYAETAPVGSYMAGTSPYGALDMAGNVWEWVADWHGSEYYASSPVRNPTGPDNGVYRAQRGGSWDSAQWYIRAAYRGATEERARDSGDGFRCARSP